MDDESTEEYEFVDHCIRLQNRINFSTPFEDYEFVDNEILPCEILSVNDISEVTENKKETGENDEENSYNNAKIPYFSAAVKGLETFRHYIESVKNMTEEIFKNSRQLDCFELQNFEAKDYS